MTVCNWRGALPQGAAHPRGLSGGQLDHGEEGLSSACAEVRPLSQRVGFCSVTCRRAYVVTCERAQEEECSEGACKRATLDKSKDRELRG